MLPASQPVTDDLRRWIVAQAEAGCAPEQVLTAMCAAGWHEDVAIAALEETLAEHLANRGAAPKLPEPDLRTGSVWLDAGDRQVQVLLTMHLPRVVVFGGLLADAECEEMMALAAQRLQRSETVEAETGGSEVNVARTSEGMFFDRAENALCARIEARIARLLQWPVSCGEGLQILRYRPGAEYLPHHDYFDPALPGSKAVLARGGQRLATLVIYLNTPTRGGATCFPEVGLEVAPVRGNAVFFNYPQPSPASRTLHAGAAVLEGEKWVATKWLRAGEFR
jgi:prolyl 4-hydroxylase